MTTSYKEHFQRFLRADPVRLHFAAHSHHYWPDVSEAAHARAWDLAAQRADRKWGPLFGDVLPRARRHIADLLSLPDGDGIAFAPNTHELVVRLVSSLERPGPLRVLTTDSEFHSFNRQSRRWEEAGLVTVERVAAEPFDDFPARFEAAARGGGHDLVFFSHVLFNSGYVVPDLARLVHAVPDDDTMVVIDGYHGFCALPTDLAPVAGRAFYLSGGYKYAMAGEGVCFVHCPPGRAARPVNTGWFAGFGDLEKPVDAEVGYAEDGMRMMGATFDPSGILRFVEVWDHWRREGLEVATIHAHVRRLQDRMLEALAAGAAGPVRLDDLIPGVEAEDRGHFLTFRTPRAGEIHDRLVEAAVWTDYRADRLRFGFALYHDAEDVDALLERLARVGA